MHENHCHLLFGKTAERCVVVLQREIPQIVHGTENAQLAEFCDPRQKRKVQERIHLFYRISSNFTKNRLSPATIRLNFPANRLTSFPFKMKSTDDDLTFFHSLNTRTGPWTGPVLCIRSAPGRGASICIAGRRLISSVPWRKRRLRSFQPWQCSKQPAGQAWSQGQHSWSACRLCRKL